VACVEVFHRAQDGEDRRKDPCQMLVRDWEVVVVEVDNLTWGWGYEMEIWQPAQKRDALALGRFMGENVMYKV
jgi:hypothetical protein